MTFVGAARPAHGTEGGAGAVVREGRDELGPVVVSESALVRWGRAIGAAARPPLWLALYGELGAGKSVLARAVCEGAGVTGGVPSPTFTLMNVYRGAAGFPIVHADLYRIERAAELDALGWDDLVRDPAVVLLEWAERAGGRQPASRWEITLAHVRDPARRRLHAVSRGAPAALPPIPAAARGQGRGRGRVR